MKNSVIIRISGLYHIAPQKYLFCPKTCEIAIARHTLEKERQGRTLHACFETICKCKYKLATHSLEIIKVSLVSWVICKPLIPTNVRFLESNK